MLTNGDSSWITPGSWFELNTFWLPANISNNKTTPPYSETFLPSPEHWKLFCLTFLRGHETQFLVATYVLSKQEIEWKAEANVAFFLLFRERPKKDYNPLSCMSHISHSILFSGIPITLFIWKYTNNNTSGEHCNPYCHWPGLEGYAVGPCTKHIH